MEVRRIAAPSVLGLLPGLVAALSIAVAADADAAAIHGNARATAIADAPAAPPSLDDCRTDDPATVLRGSALPRPARAYWLDVRRVQWPGAQRDGAFRIHWSAKGALALTADGRVEGADGTFDLAPAAGALPAPVRARFRHVADGPVLEVQATNRARLVELQRSQSILVRERDGRVVEATALQNAGALDDLHRAAHQADLGAVPGARATAFAIWAPTARAVGVCVHPDARADAAEFHALSFDPRTGVWAARLPGDLSGRYYRYVVDVHVRGIGLVRNRATDPYSVSLSADSRRSYVARLDSALLEPPGWRRVRRPPALAAPTDLVVYELHVRDFSRDDPTVPAAHRGKYLAFTHDASDGMRHLRALAQAGVTDVHLLPVFDFATVPESGCVEPRVDGDAADERPQSIVAATAARDCFNWGYDPLHFGAPEGSYATDPDDGARRIREFRAMVQALHATGLRVGMDVVYNHTMAAGQDGWSVLDRIVPDYYHRLDASGEVERSTCCANTATEHRMMERLMIDTAVLWAREHRVDSFRFDLMGHQPRAAMERLQARVNAAAGRDVPLLGEGWNFGEVADGARFVQASQLSLQRSGIATFSDRARDAVRGGGPSDRGTDLVTRRGWVNGASTPDELRRAADLVLAGLAGTLRDYELARADGRRVALAAIDYHGQPAGYAVAPGEVVNYVENHDNHTLFDANALKLPPDTTREDRARIQLLALATVAFSQGIAYFHAGGELLRSKSLDRNSFDSGDWFNRLDWRGTTNHYGTGLPPASENLRDWDVLRPRLADARIAAHAAEIAWTRDAFLDLLRIRSSSKLFRLATAHEIRARLQLHEGEPGAPPLAIAGWLRGDGVRDAGFRDVVYLLNADRIPRTVRIDALRGRTLRLHPVHTGGGADRRARDARFSTAEATFTIPPLTAVAFVGD